MDDLGTKIIKQKQYQRDMQRKISDFLNKDGMKEYMIDRKYSFREATDEVISRLELQGWYSISNDAMSQEIRSKVGVDSAKGFVLVEGLEQYFIVSLIGAKALLKKFEEDVTIRYPHWKPYRVLMREITKAQLKGLIECWEVTPCH